MTDKIVNRKYYRYLIKHLSLSILGLLLYLIIGFYLSNSFIATTNIIFIIWIIGLILILCVIIGYVLTYPLLIQLNNDSVIIRSIICKKTIMINEIKYISYGSLNDIIIHYSKLNKIFNGVVIDKDIQESIISKYNLSNLIKDIK